MPSSGGSWRNGGNRRLASFFGSAETCRALRFSSTPVRSFSVTFGREGREMGLSASDVVVWYEVLDPLVAITRDGQPMAPDYSNVYFEGTGQMRAHASTDGRRPECIPAEAMVLPSADPWERQVSPAISRCTHCEASISVHSASEERQLDD